VLIDACCTQLTAEVPDRRPPNLYEMYITIAALNTPNNISFVEQIWNSSLTNGDCRPIFSRGHIATLLLAYVSVRIIISMTVLLS